VYSGGDQIVEVEIWRTKWR